MKPRKMLAWLAVLIGTMILLIDLKPHVFASVESDRDQIIALNRVQLAAFDKKDLDTVMSFYVDDKDAVFYEDTTPFQLVGPDALRKLDLDLFNSASEIRSTMDDVDIVSSGDLAVARYALTLECTDKDGRHEERARFTQVLKRVNGKWLIWHEHFSVPFDPATGKVVLDAER